MRIDIITVLPELIKSPFEASILKRAIEAGELIHNEPFKVTAPQVVDALIAADAVGNQS